VAESPLSLLVVDDDVVDRKRIARLLSGAGAPAEIITASNIAEARERLDESSFDCALIDYQLPDGYGIELLDWLTTKGVGSIMLTGLGNEAVAAESLKRGARDYLIKSSVTAETLTRAIRDVVAKVRLDRTVTAENERLRVISFTDALTGLPNRVLFFDRLEQAIRIAARQRSHFAVAMIDLDRFKEVNDTLGHGVGDELLKAVATGLARAVRDSDTLARLGGDEFAIIFPFIDSIDTAVAAAGRVRKAIAAVGHTQVGWASVSASIGLALYPKHGKDPATLVRAADFAMLRSKSGGGGISIFGNEEEEELEQKRRVILPQSIEEAIARDEFELQFQPKISLQTGEVLGVEALVRWRHPSGRLVPPLEFIPGIERTALIRPITRMVVAKAAEQVAAWRDAGRRLPVSINLTPRLLIDRTAFDEVRDLWHEHGLAPNLLMIEVTEKAFMTNEDVARHAVERFVEAGFGISIDDFGVGHTSMRQLRDLPITELKIDKLFVSTLEREPQDRAIARSIIELGAGLNACVVAEGIESVGAWDTLVQLGCPAGQGYLIAHPMTPADFDQWWISWLRQRPSNSLRGKIEPSLR
jgi:diguanylate cyclase (GGDEF)-like protein